MNNVFAKFLKQREFDKYVTHFLSKENPFGIMQVSSLETKRSSPMSIVSLFCKRDAFFLDYASYLSKHCLPSEAVSAPRGRLWCLHPNVSVSDEILLKKRTLVESVIRELKTQLQVEHRCHRNFENFQATVFSALIAYQFLEKKPSLNLAELQEVSDLPVLF